MTISFSASPTRPARLSAFSRWLAAALPVLLLGCSVGPDYQRPDTPTPPDWLANTGKAEWPSADWWRGFKSPTLDGYVDQAQQANFDLAAAIARIREADAQAEIAGAPLLPSIGANANVTHERTSTGAGLKTFTEYAPGLTASYELDFWGKNRAAAEAAQQTALASRFDQETVELTVLTSVANSYFQALAFRDRLAVAEENLSSAETILKGLQLQEQTGVANALDVAQQQTTVSTLNATIPPLRQQLQQNLDALAILVAQPAQSVQLAPGKLGDLAFPVVAPGLPSELLARRPDVAEAEAQLKSANANITVARAAYFPSISLTGSGGFASTALGSAFNPANGIFALGAGLTQPIFEGGAIEGQYEQSKARYDELVADYKKSVISAFSNVQDALTGVQQTTDQLGRQQAAEAAAQRAYEIATSQLHAGTINILTVLNTEGALFTARDATVQARLARLQALVSLFNALGGGWQQS
jgi:NodT family efflux transporter outer membrane factor (OMF) lipoprotein